MNKRSMIYVAALVALGVGMGVYWRQPEQPAEAEPAQLPAEPVAAPPPLVAALPTAGQASLEGIRAVVAPVPASPAELQRRAEIRSKLVEAYPDLDQELELTPEEAGQFLDLLARQQAQIAELIAARSGSGANPQRLARDLLAMELSGDAEQGAMLKGKYPEWLDYQEKQLQINVVDQLHVKLLRQGVDISSAEMESLADALTAEHRRIQEELPPMAEPAGSNRRQLLELELQNAAYQRRLIAAASRRLNAQQLEAYEQLLEQRKRTAQQLLRVTEGRDEE